MIESKLFFAFVAIFLFILAIGVVGNKYNGADWGNPLTNILDGWLRFYCIKFHRLGKQHFKCSKDNKVILIANHLSAIDPFILIAATDRPIRFMIAKEEYQKPVLNWMFKAAGCIPVDRGGRVDGAFRSVLRAIEQGELVALFPQGGIHSEETPRERIKPGVVRLSQMSKSALLPVRIRGISAPGTMVECLYKRSEIQLDIEQTIPYHSVSKDDFKQTLSDWLIEKTDKLVWE